jgi:hypothetical protein
MQTVSRDRSELTDLKREHSKQQQDAADTWNAVFDAESGIADLVRRRNGEADPEQRRLLSDRIAALEAEMHRLRNRFAELSEASLKKGRDVARLEARVHEQIERELGRTPFTQGDLLYLEHCLEERYVPLSPMCTLAATWDQSLAGRGNSRWVISASGGAVESGLGNAAGIATLSGRTLTISFDAPTGHSGAYVIDLNLNCTGGQGMMTLTAVPDGDSIVSLRSTFTRVN